MKSKQQFAAMLKEAERRTYGATSALLSIEVMLGNSRAEADKYLPYSPSQWAKEQVSVAEARRAVERVQKSIKFIRSDLR